MIVYGKGDEEYCVNEVTPMYDKEIYSDTLKAFQQASLKMEYQPKIGIREQILQSNIKPFIPNLNNNDDLIGILNKIINNK